MIDIELTIRLLSVLFVGFGAGVLWASSLPAAAPRPQPKATRPAGKPSLSDHVAALMGSRVLVDVYFTDTKGLVLDASIDSIRTWNAAEPEARKRSVTSEPARGWIKPTGAVFAFEGTPPLYVPIDIPDLMPLDLLVITVEARPR